MPGSKTVWAVVLALMVCALGVIYFFVDPMEASWMPRCIWKVATGTDCPGCGSQRMAHALLHADFAEAWRANAFALCMIPLIGFLVWLEFFREKHPRLYGKVHSPRFILMLASAVVGWWIFRNLV